MNDHPCPAACPVCGECQNTLPGDFDPDRQPFGPVHCMVCGHEFSAAEYSVGMDARRKQLDAMGGPVEK